MAFPLSTQRLDVPGQNGGAEFLTLVSLEPKCALVTISAKQEECNFTVFQANIIMHILTIAIYSQIHSTFSSSSPHVLSHISVSLDRHAPLCRWSVTGIFDPLASNPWTYKKWADFSLLPALEHSSMKALIPSRIRVPGQFKRNGNNGHIIFYWVPSTTMHSSKTCPEVRARGFSRRPLQAGHQIWRAYPGLGVLFPSGTWSISHCDKTFKFVMKSKSKDKAK